jgi:hypothetical protein
MTIQAAIKKIEKSLNVKVEQNRNAFQAIFGNQTIQFYKNGSSEEITCIRTWRGEDKSDSMTDYTHGVFHDNITRAIRYVQIY